MDHSTRAHEYMHNTFITKRSGDIVLFEAERIKSAVQRCFESIGRNGSSREIAATIATRVVNYLYAKKFDKLEIEDVQRAVISQLWAEGQVQAAEHYTLYREQRRKEREDQLVNPEHVAAILSDQQHFPTQLQYYQFVSKFAKWREDKGRRETWGECVDRVFAWFATTPGWGALDECETTWLRQMMYDFKASPAMRVVQMAGPALERDNLGCFNCTYAPIVDLFSFAEHLYILMQGCGCLPGDTPILTEVGPREIQSVRVGDNVWSYNIKTGHQELRLVTEEHRVIVKREDNVKLQTRHGWFITSRIHPVLVWRTGAWEYIPAESVKLGDYLHKMAQTEIHGKRNDKAWFAGAFLGDGCSDLTKYSSRRIRITKDDLGFMETFATVLSDLSGEQCQIKPVGEGRYSIPMWILEKQIHRDNQLVQNWQDIVGDLPTHKTLCLRVPAWIRSNTDMITFLSFLSGLIDSDGYVLESKVIIATSSPVLVDDILALSSLHALYPAIHTTHPEDYTSNGFTPTVPMHRITFSLYDFMPYLHFFSHSAKQQRLRDAASVMKPSNWRKHISVPPDKISSEIDRLGMKNQPNSYHFKKKIEETGQVTAGWYASREVSFSEMLNYDVVEEIHYGVDVSENFYDITVESNNSYYCGHGSFFVSHNSGFSVENDYISKLPRIKKQIKQDPEIHIIPDTTEGWCDALLAGMTAWFGGRDLEFDYALIRPKGTPLKTKGGTASGSGPLRNLLEFSRRIILARQGRHLSDIDVHDICCMIGKIVQLGGVRRASCISLSDLDSSSMRTAKHGNWWLENSQRSMANNSAVYNEKPTMEQFMSEWLGLVQSRSGERGIVNRAGMIKNRPARRKKSQFGVNPCSEIQLRPNECCNLSMSILKPSDTQSEIEDKIRAATYFGTLQSCCTKFNYVRKEWGKNCEEERLLGVDIMGHLDHDSLAPFMGVDREARRAKMSHLRDFVMVTNVGLARRMGINPSVAATCLKPGGDSGVFFGSSNLSPWFAEYQIRRTRENRHSPVAKLLVAQGVPHEDASEDSELLAFAWPKRNPSGCVTRDMMTAIQQLENWLDWQEAWCDHAASVTIYVRDDEWFEVGAWCWSHFDRLSGLSFLPYDNGTYRSVPNEEVTKEKYEELATAFPVIDWSKLTKYENRDMTTSAQTYACTGGFCEI